MEELQIVVEGDHLERVARATPIKALSEAVWNALDAEATSISIEIEPAILGGEHAVGSIIITDNGHGMNADDVKEGFGRLGGSWKASRGRSKNNVVALHGQEGQGRFRTLTLGGTVQWESISKEEPKLQHSVTIRRTNLKRCELGTRDSHGDPGTRVSILDPTPAAQKLLDLDDVRSRLTGMFALRLEAQSGLSILVNDEELDPSALQSGRHEYTVPIDDDTEHPVNLVVVEWSRDVDRSIHLCDEQQMSLHSIPPGIQAPTFSFTAYASWPGFRQHQDVISLGDLSADIGPAVRAIQDQLRDHFRQRAEERDTEIIQGWQNEGVYPYKQPKGEVSNTERLGRQVFDLVALTMHAATPGFAKADSDGKRVTLRLLQESVEKSPESVHKILQEVSRLDTERLTELADILEHTELAKIIQATRRITDRLHFLHGLEALLFDVVETREKAHIHPILAAELWLFGDHFESAISERGLTNALRQHISILGRVDLVKAPVTKEDGSQARLDLMLSARVAGRGSHVAEHLVIELKSPNVTLSMAEFGQINDYASAVLDNPRFHSEETFWEFWLIGNTMDKSLSRLVANSGNSRTGFVTERDNYRVRVVEWSQLLEEHRRRLQFMSEALEYRADDSASASYLTRTHAKYLPMGGLQLSGDEPHGATGVAV